MIGLSLGWRAYSSLAGDGLGAVAADATLMIGGGFFIFAFAAYLAKLTARPSALMQDLNPIVGRAAVSAGSMCMMMLAAGVHQAMGWEATARALWFGGILLHILYACCVAFIYFKSPKGQRIVAPPLFLPAIGLIVAPIGGVPLGYQTLSSLILAYAIPVGLIIGWMSIRAFRSGRAPDVLRPTAAIALAPASVAGSAAGLLGYDGAFVALLCLSVCLAAACLCGVRWMTKGGFTPIWGAFTFPASAFAALLVSSAARWGGVWDSAAFAALVAASFVVLPIWVLTVRAWAQGRLAPATGATAV